MFERVDKDFRRHEDEQQIAEEFEKQHESQPGGKARF
jgi:hypothetical protein